MADDDTGPLEVPPGTIPVATLEARRLSRGPNAEGLVEISLAVHEGPQAGASATMRMSPEQARLFGENVVRLSYPPKD